MNTVRKQNIVKHSHLVIEFANLRRGKVRARLENGLRSIGWLEPDVDLEEYEDDELSSSESESGDGGDRKAVFSGSAFRCQDWGGIKRPDDFRCQLMDSCLAVTST